MATLQKWQNLTHKLKGHKAPLFHNTTKGNCTMNMVIIAYIKDGKKGVALKGKTNMQGNLFINKMLAFPTNEGTDGRIRFTLNECTEDNWETALHWVNNTETVNQVI